MSLWTSFNAQKYLKICVVLLDTLFRSRTQLQYGQNPKNQYQNKLSTWWLPMSGNEYIWKWEHHSRVSTAFLILYFHCSLLGCSWRGPNADGSLYLWRSDWMCYTQVCANSSFIASWCCMTEYSRESSWRRALVTFVYNLG